MTKKIINEMQEYVTNMILAREHQEITDYKDHPQYESFTQKLLGSLPSEILFDLVSVPTENFTFASQKFIDRFRNTVNAYDTQVFFEVEEDFRLRYVQSDPYDTPTELPVSKGTILRASKHDLYQSRPYLTLRKTSSNMIECNEKSVKELLESGSIKQISLEQAHPKLETSKRELTTEETKQLEQLSKEMIELTQSVNDDLPFPEFKHIQDEIAERKEAYTALLTKAFSIEDIVHTMINENKQYISSGFYELVKQQSETKQVFAKSVTLYHKSNTVFETFSNELLDNSNQGLGISFNKTIDLTKQPGEQGYVYKCDVLLKNSLSDSAITIPKSAYKSLIQHIPTYLAAYLEPKEATDHSIDEIVNQDFEYCESDTELIANLYHSTSQIRSILEYLNEQFDYNHVVYEMPNGEESIVCFSANDINMNQIYDINVMQNKLSNLSNEDITNLKSAIHHINSPLNSIPLDPNNIVLNEEIVNDLVSWEIENEVDLNQEIEKEMEFDELEF